MARKLDKTRPYSTVHGNDGGNEAFMQDGFHFNAKGEEIGPAGSVEQPKEPSKPAPKVSSQLDKQLAP